MPTKIRLQRHGKKGQPFYHIVIADSRSPRNGRFIEKIGTYNPVKNPAEIVLDFDKAVYWLGTGAQPTDTARTILSQKGAIYKNHLLKGVAKGALTQEQADVKYNEWIAAKEAKSNSALNNILLQEKEAKKKALDAEKEVADARAAEIAKRKADERAAIEAAAAEKAAAEAPADEAKEENTEAAE